MTNANEGALTAERLREVLDFDGEHFYWKAQSTGSRHRNSRVPPGTEAGTLHGGCRRIQIDNRVYAQWQLAHLWEHGVLPESSRKHSETRDALTSERLKELILYHPDTGVFEARSHPGVTIGCLNDSGYRLIHVAGHTYRAARLAAARQVYGEFTRV